MQNTKIPFWEKAENVIKKISRLFDRVAGLGVVLLMALVVINAITRTAFGAPILGVYEYVGFLAASIIGLALAHCSVQSGHIAISLITDKLHDRAQIFVDTFAKILSVVVLGLFSYQMVLYAVRSAASGEVSLTTWIPIFPFILIVALGFMGLTLVVFVKLITNLKAVANK